MFTCPLIKFRRNSIKVVITAMLNDKYMYAHIFMIKDPYN